MAKKRLFRRALALAALIYLGLLTASHLRPRHAQAAEIPPGFRFEQVRAVAGDRLLEDTVRFAYRDSEPSSSRRPLILVHGSPGDADVFDELYDLISPEYRVIAVDLPGFGHSTRQLPDYSFRAHANYLIQLMDRLQINTADLLGFSMGGGVVLSAFDLAPERVSSLTMLSAIGVQEEELLHSYWKNHAVHGAQLGLLWLLMNATPHFGLFDEFPLSLEYARNFYDSDQRPLRAVLQRYRGPMLIIHGTRDNNVPIQAAREHHRLVPQSTLIEIPTDHFMAFMHPSVFVQPLKRFLTSNRGADHTQSPHVRPGPRSCFRPVPGARTEPRTCARLAPEPARLPAEECQKA